MADVVKVFFLVLSALFPIVDPLAGSPIFLSLTIAYSSETRRELSRRVAIHSFFLMIGSYFIGSYVLSFFGVSLPVVQVGGGLVVVTTGWLMLMQNDDGGNPTRRIVEPHDVFGQAFYPLTLPLTVGPGSISVAITLGANSTHGYGYGLYALNIVAAIIAMGVVAVSVYICYGFSDRLARMLGTTGMTVIMRLTAFLLVCIGVQITWNGLSTLLSSLQLGAR